MSAVKGTPPMVVTTTRDGDTVTVKVEHHDHQSFSRAVDPRATKEMRRFMAQHGIRNAALVNVDYCVTDPAPRRTVSAYTYEVK